MNRREAVRALGSLAAIPVLAALDADALLAFAGRAHAHRGPAWTPRAFTREQAEVLAAIAELIIPRTSTAGAIDAGVPEFIDYLAAELFDDAERARLAAGILDFDARTLHETGQRFAYAAPERQAAALTDLSQEYEALRRAEDPRADQHFFHTMKWLTLFGYYTSEAGATSELHHVVIPGAFQGCTTWDDAHIH